MACFVFTLNMIPTDVERKNDFKTRLLRNFYFSLGWKQFRESRGGTRARNKKKEVLVCFRRFKFLTRWFSILCCSQRNCPHKLGRFIISGAFRVASGIYRRLRSSRLENCRVCHFLVAVIQVNFSRRLHPPTTSVLSPRKSHWRNAMFHHWS